MNGSTHHKKTQPTRIERFALVVAGAACIASAVVGGVMAAEPAHAETGLQSLKIKSMNDCRHTYRHPHSEKARDCRSRGWSVIEHASISPNDRAWTDFGPCRQEDSEDCWWNARTMGNGHGQSFVNARHLGVFYVNRINGVRA